MRSGFIIRDPETKLCWSQSAAWTKPQFAKVYPTKGRAKAAVSYHRCDHHVGPMDRPIEIVEVELIEKGVELVPCRRKKSA